MTRCDFRSRTSSNVYIKAIVVSDMVRSREGL